MSKVLSTGIRQSPINQGSVDDAVFEEADDNAVANDFVRLRKESSLPAVVDKPLQDRLSSESARQLPEKLLGDTVSGMIARRAKHYAGNHVSGDDIEKASRVLLHVLDSRALPVENKKANGGVFPADLAHLFDDVRVRAFLVRADEALEKAKKGGAPVELWPLALEHAGGDATTALRWLAVMLQDTDTFANVRIVGRVYGQTPDVERLSRLCEAVRNTRLVRALPNGADAQFESTALYHFYVPAYAVALMREKGIAPQTARAVACVFNTTYEFFRHRLISGIDRVPAPGIDNGIGVGAIVWGLLKTAWQSLFPSDPKSIQVGTKPTNPSLFTDAAVEHRHVMSDCYFGFAGADFGAQITRTHVPSLPNKDSFDRAFSTNPRAFLEGLFSTK